MKYIDLSKTTSQILLVKGIPSLKVVWLASLYIQLKNYSVCLKKYTLSVKSEPHSDITYDAYIVSYISYMMYILH